MNELIELKSVNKTYNNGMPFAALCDISLSIAKQDYLAITGPSGAGKSTLLHIIGGLEPPTSGEVFFQEKQISKLNDRDLCLWRNKTVGFVFQFFVNGHK